MTDTNGELSGEQPVVETLDEALRAFRAIQREHEQQDSGATASSAASLKPPHFSRPGTVIEGASSLTVPLIVERYEAGEWRYVRPQDEEYDRVVRGGAFQGDRIEMDDDLSLWLIGADGNLRAPIGRDPGQAAFVGERAAPPTTIPDATTEF